MKHLQTDYDRMIGESYKEYASRCRGRMLAAEQDRDALAAKVARVRALIDDVEWGDMEPGIAQKIREALDGAGP